MLCSRTGPLTAAPLITTSAPMRCLVPRAAGPSPSAAHSLAAGKPFSSSAFWRRSHAAARPAVPKSSEVPATAPSAATAADRAQDVGNIVFLEHVYLVVPDLEVARLFYGEGLGLTHDPGTLGGAHRGGMNVVHYNIGRQQIHIEKGYAAQPLPKGGAIGLVIPNLTEVTHRLELVEQYLGDISISHVSHGVIEVSDPYGTSFILHESLPDFPSSRGICYLLLPCHAGSAVGIGQFYRDVLGALVVSEPTKPCECDVVVGPGTRLMFREVAELKERSDEGINKLWSGWHTALYVADFSSVYNRLASAGLIYNDHPFVDKCYSLEDALRNKQLRFANVVGPSTSPAPLANAAKGNGKQQEKQQLLYRFEHEVRSLHHPRFMRPLYNRLGPNFDVLG